MQRVSLNYPLRSRVNIIVGEIKYLLPPDQEVHIISATLHPLSTRALFDLETTKLIPIKPKQNNFFKQNYSIW